MKKQTFNQELFNKVVESVKREINISYDAVNKNNALEDGVKDLKWGYEQTTKANPHCDMLDEYTVHATQLWTSQGIPHEYMALIWYKVGEKFLKSYVQHFIKSK